MGSRLVGSPRGIFAYPGSAVSQQREPRSQQSSKKKKKKYNNHQSRILFLFVLQIRVVVEISKKVNKHGGRETDGVHQAGCRLQVCLSLLSGERKANKETRPSRRQPRNLHIIMCLFSFSKLSFSSPFFAAISFCRI